jgi:hypothetical protein
MKTLKIIFLTAFIFISANLPAFDFLTIFLHSEIAEKNSVFADVGLAPFVFKDMEFNILPLDVRAEYMPPLPLPFSFGLFLKTPYPNFKSFGTRIGYHFNFLIPSTDFYVVYSYDFGFLRRRILEKYHDTSIPVHFYDFRFGVRYLFKSRFGFAVETGFKFKDVIFLGSIKIY